MTDRALLNRYPARIASKSPITMKKTSMRKSILKMM